MRKNTDFESTLLLYISYKHWRIINVDQAMFQPFLFAGAYSEEFVLRICFPLAFRFVLFIVYSYFFYSHIGLVQNQKTLTDKAKPPY